MAKSIIAAALGSSLGAFLGLLFVWAGPRLAEWIKGPPRLDVESWVLCVVVMCGAGFGAVAGAVVGGVASIVAALRSRN